MSTKWCNLALVILIMFASVTSIITATYTRYTISETNILLLDNSPDQGSRSSANYSYIVISPDWKRMGWTGPNGTYHAGDDLYLKITAYDENASMCADLNSEILVGQTSTGSGELEPEPWKSHEDECLTFQFINGVARNPEGSIMRFFKVEEINFVAFEGSNGNKYTSDEMRIHPSKLAILIADPGELTIKTGDSQEFGLSGTDRFGNPVDLISENWTVDKHINHDESEKMYHGRTFKAVEYVPNYIRTGFIHATATGPTGKSVRMDIPVTVEGVYDVWLEEDEVWPDHVLANEPLELTANIHYTIPANKLIDDTLEIRIRFALMEVDENGNVTNVLIDLYRGNVDLSNLYGEPERIHTVHRTIPQEFYRDHVNYHRKGMMDADKKSNYIMVELEDIPGESSVSEFDSESKNIRVMGELFCVVPPPGGGCPSFAPTISSLLLSLVLFGIFPTLFSKRRRTT